MSQATDEPFSPRLVAFDLDDTLAPSKTRLPERMARLIIRLTASVPVCVISGGQFQQFQQQLLEGLDAADGGGLDATRLHLMPTCGTQYYRFERGQWERVYSQPLTDHEKRETIRALTEEAQRLGLWETDTWGPVLEDRESQITFSALGQQAPVDAKAAWDPTGTRRRELRDAVAARVPELEVRAGGSTSIDVTRRGIDKAYGITRLAEITGIPFADMLFVGDRLEPGGNDYPVIALGVHTHAVTGWEDTAVFLEQLIPTLQPQA